MFKARSFALFHPPQPRPSPPFFYHFAASNVRRYSPSSGLPSPLPWKHKESPYDILGVSRTADAKEIKKRYFELSFINHPDKNLEKTPAVQEKLSREFMAIQEAYEVLKDANLRQEYNLYGGSRNVGEWVRRDSANRAYSGSGAFRMQEEGTQPEGEFKIFRPWLYGVGILVFCTWMMMSSMAGRQEDMKERAWQDWHNARRNEIAAYERERNSNS